MSVEEIMDIIWKLPNLLYVYGDTDNPCDDRLVVLGNSSGGYSEKISVSDNATVKDMLVIYRKDDNERSDYEKQKFVKAYMSFDGRFSRKESLWTKEQQSGFLGILTIDQLEELQELAQMYQSAESLAKENG